MRQLLYLLKGTDVTVNIELKTGIWFYAGIEDQGSKKFRIWVSKCGILRLTMPL